MLAVALIAGVAPGRAGAVTPSTPLLGVYDGNQGWAMQEVADLERWQGRTNAVVELFTNWDGSRKVLDNLFNLQLPAIWNNGNVPLITWEPFLARTTPADIEVRIASGAYDSYVRTWAARLGTFLAGPDGKRGTADDRRAYIRLAHEMNADWYPWGAATGGNRASDYVAMWRRVHSVATQAGGFDASRVQWIWAVNEADFGGVPAEAFWPGADVVDWVGIDGYNWGTTLAGSAWRSPEAVLGPMLARLRTLAPGKPVSIAEVATTSRTAAGNDVSAKSTWITDSAAWAVANGVGMLVWFNDDKETDWAVFGGARGDVQVTYGATTYSGYSAYAQAVSGGSFAGGSKADPRRITDAQFRGQI